MSINNVSAVSDALKYVNGADVTEENASIVSDVKDSVLSPITLIFGGMQASSELKSVTGAEKLIKSSKNANGEITNSSILKLASDGKLASTIKGVNTSTSVSNQFSSAVESFVKLADDKVAKKAAESATASTAKKGIFSSIKSFLSKAGSTISSYASKIPGVSTAAKQVSKLGSTSFGKVLKGTGAVGFMVFDGIIGLFTEVVPAFKQGGAEAGFKQLAKTGTKAVANGLGWAGGSVAGKAVGAAVGSLFGPVGTVVGGALGSFLGGTVGSALASGIAGKITGKSETEKIQDEQYEEAAAQIASDSASMDELNALVYQQVQAEIQSGCADEDTELMAKYLNEGAFTTSGSTGNNIYPSATTTTDGTTYINGTTTDSSNYWSQMASRIASGDTSIYDISDEQLNKKFRTSSNTTSSTSSTFDSTDSTSDVIDYFG